MVTSNKKRDIIYVILHLDDFVALQNLTMEHFESCFKSAYLGCPSETAIL